MIVDVLAPGQGFESDPDAMLRRTFSQFAKILRGAVDAAAGQRRDVRADEHEIRAQLLHDVELPLGALEGTRSLRFRHSLEVSKRLKQGDLKAEIPDHPADIAG